MLRLPIKGVLLEVDRHLSGAVYEINKQMMSEPLNEIFQLEGEVVEAVTWLASRISARPLRVRRLL